MLRGTPLRQDATYVDLPADPRHELTATGDMAVEDNHAYAPKDRVPWTVCRSIPIRLGLRENAGQFAPLAVVNAFAARAKVVDRVGMWLQTLGIGIVTLSRTVEGLSIGAVLLGVGTAVVYPTLLAAVGDVAHPTWRASAVGVYRLRRYFGCAVGRCWRGSSPMRGLRAAGWAVPALMRLGLGVGPPHERDAAPVAGVTVTAH